MKRRAIAILLHPYKNVLVPVSRLKESVDAFAGALLKLAAGFPGMHWNLLLPGYMLERIDSILLSKIREIQKRGALEWLCCGYTEPFLSFSPVGLSQENVRAGCETLINLTERPAEGFAPPFSNWEPSFIPVLNALGFRYATVSEMLFAAETRSFHGYWATEFGGATINLIPMRSLHPYAAPQHVEAWLENSFDGAMNQGSGAKLFCIDYLMPLVALDQPDPFIWLQQVAEIMEKNAIAYQSVCFHECMAMTPPNGLHYPLSSVMFAGAAGCSSGTFLDYLHTFDQVGILQRRMMEIDENLCSRPPSRHISDMRKRLFFLQDINRFLPAERHGFLCAADRNWVYENLIALDTQLHEHDAVKGGQIRISDFLKNGSKCAIMANKSLKVYIDHRSGGHIFELDFRYRKINMCSVCTPERHSIPRIIMPGKTKTAFADHLIGEEIGMEAFAAAQYVELGDFCGAAFDYTVKKTRSGVRCILVRNGSVAQGGKSAPITLEKVFGLENDDPVLSFVYKFSTPSMAPLAFRLAIAIALFLPGAETGEAHVSHGRTGVRDLRTGRAYLTNVTKLIIGDHACGVHLALATQKAVDVWCYPIGANAYQGTMLAISSQAKVASGAPWTLMGKLEMKKTRIKARQPDAC